MADAADSKSAGSDPVRVQVPSSAPDEQAFLAESLFFIIISEFRQNVFQMYCAENFFSCIYGKSCSDLFLYYNAMKRIFQDVSANLIIKFYVYDIIRDNLLLFLYAL